LPQVDPDVTGPRRIFTTKLGQLKTAAEGEVYGRVNMTPDKRAEMQLHRSSAVTEATPCSIADMDCVGN